MTVPLRVAVRRLAAIGALATLPAHIIERDRVGLIAVAVAVTCGTAADVALVVRRLRARERARLRAHTTEASVIELRDLPARVVAAAWIAEPRAVIRHHAMRFRVWSALPGDRFDCWVRDLRLEVVRVTADGPQLRVIGNTRGSPIRHPMWTVDYYVARNAPPGAYNVLHPNALAPVR